MPESYNYKLIKSGVNIEVYDYKEKYVLRGYKRKDRIKKVKTPIIEHRDENGNLLGPNGETFDLFKYEEINAKEEAEKQEKEKEQKMKTMFSLSRTRNNIRRIINANPELTAFLTLTFGESMTELKEANYIFNQFIKRMINLFPDFQYIAVPEFQKDHDYFGNKKENGGSVHYHLLCNFSLPNFEAKKELFAFERFFAKEYWKQGFIKLKEVDHITNMGAYFCKYLGKDMFDKRTFGKKKFFRSQSLSEPIELLGYYALKFFQKFVQGLKPVFEKTFRSDWTGLIDYRAYALEEEANRLACLEFAGFKT